MRGVFKMTPSEFMLNIGNAFAKGFSFGYHSFNPLACVRITIPWMIFGMKMKPVVMLKDVFKNMSDCVKM